MPPNNFESPSPLKMTPSNSSDLPLHLGLCRETASEAEKAAVLLQKLREKMSHAQEDEEPPTSDGLSFLELKNLLMVDYLSDLTLLLLTKSHGKSITSSESVDRLVTLRTVLEKMRPIERKLKYQIDKAVKIASSADDAEGASDPLSFKANPANLMSKLGDDNDDDDSEDEDDEDGSGDGKKKVGKYMVPKHVPTFYEEDKTTEDLEEEKSAKKKKSLLSKGLIEDLKRQHMDTPEEIHEREGFTRRKQINDMKERQRYEEDHFIRLPVSKKMKHSAKQMSTIGSIGDEVTAFGSSFGGSSSKTGGKKRKGGGGFKKGSAKKKFKGRK